MKAVVAAFNQEKALVGAFSVITTLRMELFEAPLSSLYLQPISTQARGALPPPLVRETLRAWETVQGRQGGEQHYTLHIIYSYTVSALYLPTIDYLHTMYPGGAQHVVHAAGGGPVHGVGGGLPALLRHGQDPLPQVTLLAILS